MNKADKAKISKVKTAFDDMKSAFTELEAQITEEFESLGFLIQPFANSLKEKLDGSITNTKESTDNLEKKINALVKLLD